MRLDVTMDMQVLFQVALVTKTSTTDITLKRFFACMCSFVVLVSTTTYEEFLAIVALPFSRMRAGFLDLNGKSG
jgi:hypothetical protein